MKVDQHGTKRFIGIDGGGTKTTCVIGDGNGEILAVAHGKSSNIQTKPLDDVKEILTGLIEDVMARTNSRLPQLTSIYFSMAGCDRPEDKRKLLQAFRSFSESNANLVLENDAMGALAAGTWGKPGLVLIAGTGSIAYAYPSFGEPLIRAGGWGYLLGDEGGGYDIGRSGLTAALRQFDGRGTKTIMTELLMEKLDISNPAEIVTAVYGKDDIRGGIADLSKVVFAAAKQEDTVALEIIDKAIGQLTLLVETVRNRVAQQTKLLFLTVSGGLFQDEFFKNKFDEEASRRFDNLSLIYPSLPPVVGAFILALQHSRENITENLKTTTEVSWANLTARRR